MEEETKEDKGGVAVNPIGMNAICFSHFFLTVLVFASNVCSLVLEHFSLFGSVLTHPELELRAIFFVGFLTM